MKTEWYKKLAAKLDKIKSGELDLDEYIKEVNDKIKNNGQIDISINVNLTQVICPECGNPYPHSYSDNSYHCEDCNHKWR